MHEIILHQYSASPFSEKVRLTLGRKRLRWRSVEQPSILPKPDLVVGEVVVHFPRAGFLVVPA